MLRKLFLVGAAVASAGAAIGFVKGRAEFRTSGIDRLEQEKPLPGDDIVPEADGIDTRGIDIDATPDKVWPWLVQMGYGRAGWYSYDQLDMNHPSADHIVPELQELAVGDILPTHPGGGFEVRILEPEKALVLYVDRTLVDTQAAAASEAEAAPANVRATGKYLETTMRGAFRASWAFVLEPLPGGRTRLIERFRGWMAESADGGAAHEGPPVGKAIASKALLFGLFVMVRRQLLGIRDRVEGRPTAAFPWAMQPWARSAQGGRPAEEAVPAGQPVPA